MPAHILIVNGNTSAANDKMVALGGRPYGEGYAAALRFFEPGLDCTVLDITEDDALPAGMGLTDFDGVAWTGSALSVTSDVPEVSRQIAFARAVFEARRPSFGSCWGLQVMCATLGGSVHANPKGIEIGIARRIRLTGAGRSCPLYAGKPRVFDAVAIHRDEVCQLPPGAITLASNDVSAVQAIEIPNGEGTFWGVQYHPEFDLETVGRLLRRDQEVLIEQGLFRSPGDVASVVADYQALNGSPARCDLAWRYGLDGSVLDPANRMAELGNWLASLVLPRAT